VSCAIVRSADGLLDIVRKRDEIVRNSDDRREIVGGPDDLPGDTPTPRRPPGTLQSIAG